LGLSETKICYAIGNAAWGAKDITVGLPIVDHFEPEPVIDAASAPLLAQSASFPDGRDSKIGTMYYVADFKIPFTPAHGILLLNKFFESTIDEGTPDYGRYYHAEDINPVPQSPYLNIWKKLKKTGWNHNGCWSSGIVTGISISKAPNQPLLLGARCAFAKRDLGLADPGSTLWPIDWTGDCTVPKDGNINFYCATPGGTFGLYRATSFNINLSCDFTPHFWGGMNPDAFTRGKIALTGDIELRDITNQVELFTAWLESSATRSIRIEMGNNICLRMNVNIPGGGASEDEITRNGKFGITGVAEETAGMPLAFELYVKPGKEYIAFNRDWNYPDVRFVPVEEVDYPINEPIAEEA
jgi:hypothetical protein